MEKNNRSQPGNSPHHKTNGRGDPGWLLANWQQVLILTLFWTLLVFVLSVDFFSKDVSGLETGKPSPMTVKASRPVSFVDEEKTSQLRKTAAESVEPVYKLDVTVEKAVERALNSFFSKVSQTAANQAVNLQGKTDLLSAQFNGKVSRDTLAAIVQLETKKLENFKSSVIELTLKIGQEKIKESELLLRRNELKAAALKMDAAPEMQAAAAEIGSYYLRANYFHNPELTKQIKEEAENRVPQQIVSKMEGEVIVREGEIVSEEGARFLRELGLLRDSADWKRIFGIMLVVISLLLIFGFFLHEYYHKIYHQNKLLVLTGLIITTEILLAKLITPFYPFYVIPVTAGGMMVAVLINPALAIFVLLSSIILIGLIPGAGVSYILASLLGGIFSIYVFAYYYQKGKTIPGAALSSLIIAFSAFAASLIFELSLLNAAYTGGIGLVGGFFSVVLTVGFIPFLEMTFDLATNFRLLELANPNHPLLKELIFSSPGTYNHSIIVGNLAESAASEIGANPLLARVGAYYHDIGKIKRPAFFIENQLGNENPHDRTNPNLSTLIITSHIKDGLELGKSHRLPEELMDIINEHHGNGLVTYFYHKAREQGKNDKIREENFRYSGKKPQSKESAIIMLADSLEASARALARPTETRLKQLVKKVVEEKIRDGQLDESELTLLDLDRISAGFVKTLVSSYHTRIEYPENGEIKEIKPLESGNPAE